MAVVEELPAIVVDILKMEEEEPLMYVLIATILEECLDVELLLGLDKLIILWYMIYLNK